MLTAGLGVGLAVAGDDAYTFVDLLVEQLWGGCAFEEGDAVLAAGGEHLLARLLHLGRVRIARDRLVAEGVAEVARAKLGETEAWHRQDLVRTCDTLRTLQLHPEQQFTVRIERPRIGLGQILVLRDAPDRHRRRLRATPTRPEAEQWAAVLAAGRAARGAAQPIDRLGEGRVGADGPLRVT